MVPDELVHAGVRNEAVCKLLLRAGARVDARDAAGLTPLEVARRAKKADVINFLEQIDAEKDKGVDPLPLCAGPNGSCSDAGCALS